MNSFRPSVEPLETRETPAGTSLASTTDLIIDSYNPAPAGFSGTGVYRSMDGGVVWAAAPSGTSGRITGVVVDPDAARFFNGFVSRVSAGDANETITIGGARTETVDPARPTILLQRLANPALPATQTGSVYTVTFGGSLVG